MGRLSRSVLVPGPTHGGRWTVSQAADDSDRPIRTDGGPHLVTSWVQSLATQASMTHPTWASDEDDRAADIEACSLGLDLCQSACC